MSDLIHVEQVVVVCGERAEFCVCALPPHGDDVPHECQDRGRCGGSWFGGIGSPDFRVVRLPGFAS